MKKFGARILIPLILFGGLDIAKAKDVEQRTELADASKAEKFIEDLGSSAFEIVRNENLNQSGVKKRFDSLFETKFDLLSFAKFVKGRGFNDLTDEQKKNFIEDLKSELFGRYLFRFSEYKSSEFFVKKGESTEKVIKRKGRVCKQIRVKSVLKASNEIDIDWIVYLVDGVAKVFDVITEKNISVAVVMKDVYKYKALKEKKSGK